MHGKDLILFKHCVYFDLRKTRVERFRTNYINPHKNGDSLLAYLCTVPLKLSFLNVLVFVGCIP